MLSSPVEEEGLSLNLPFRLVSLKMSVYIVRNFLIMMCALRNILLAPRFLDFFYSPNGKSDTQTFAKKKQGETGSASVGSAARHYFFFRRIFSAPIILEDETNFFSIRAHFKLPAKKEEKTMSNLFRHAIFCGKFDLFLIANVAPGNT